MKQQSLLSRGIGSWSRSIITTIMEMQLSFLHMVIKQQDFECDIKAYIQHPYPTLRLHLPLKVTQSYTFHALKKANK